MKANDLMSTWGERDDRYALRKQSLSEDEINAVMLWRRKEAMGLVDNEQTKALTALSLWIVPIMRR